MLRSAFTAILIAMAIQIFTIGIMAPRLPREVCRPGIDEIKRLSLPSATTFRLVNTDGAVQIIPTDRKNSIDVDVRIRVYTSGSDTLETAATYVSTLFRTTQSDNAVELVAEPEQRPDMLDLRLDFQITIPRGTDVSLDIANGNIGIAEGCNHIAIEANNSDITLLKPSGKVSVKTVNGRIKALECKDETILETVNGNIQTSLYGGSLQASTVTGGIVVNLLNSNITTCDLTSLNGNITLVMSERLSVAVSAVTARGSVRSEIPLVPLHGGQKRREVHGVIGKGSTQVSVNSMNGDIVLQRSVT